MGSDSANLRVGEGGFCDEVPTRAVELTTLTEGRIKACGDISTLRFSHKAWFLV
jgi:hypothetical protein